MSHMTHCVANTTSDDDGPHTSAHTRSPIVVIAPVTA